MAEKKDFQKIIISTFSRFSYYIMSLIALFFLTPFTINKLGNYNYGVWVLVSIFADYSCFTELGINSAIERNLAVAISNNDEKYFNKIFINGLFLNIITFLIITTVTLLASSGFIVFNFKNYEIIAPLILLVGLSTAFMFPFRTYTAILTANIRFEITSYIRLVELSIRSILIVLFLLKGYGLVALGFSLFISTMISNVLFCIFGKKLASFLNLKFSYINKETLKDLFKFGLKTFIIQLSNMLRFKLDEIVIGAFISVKSITSYSIANKLNTNANQFYSSFLDVFNPFFAQQLNNQSKENTKKMYFLFSKVTISLTTFIFSGFLLLGYPFIKLWMGINYVNAYYPLIILGAAYYLTYIQAVGVNYIFAINKHQYLGYVTIFEGILNLILSIMFVLTFKLGIIGVALGTLVASITTKIFIQPLIVCYFLQITKKTYYKFYLTNLFKGLTLYSFVGYGIWVLNINNYSVIVLSGFALLITAIIHFIIILNKDEKIFLINKMISKYAFIENILIKINN